MKYTLKNSSENTFKVIEINEKELLIHSGSNDKIESTQTETFERSYKVRDKAEKTIKSLLREGFGIYVPQPEGLFITITDEEQDEHDFYLNQLVIVDIDDEKKVSKTLDTAFQYVNDFFKSGMIQFSHSPEYLFHFVKKTKEGYEEFEFFSEVLEKHPHLENKVAKWLQFAIDLKYGIYTEEGNSNYLFGNVASALLYFNSDKYFDQYLQFLNTWDWDHETDVEEDEIYHLIEKFGAESDEGLKTIAARRTFLAGQHGTELELDEYINIEDDALVERFWQFFQQSMIIDNTGEVRTRIKDYNYQFVTKNIWMFISTYVQDVMNELGIKFDMNRMIQAVGTTTKDNTYTLKQILDPNFEFDLPPAFSTNIGRSKWKKGNHEEAIKYFTKSIEKEHNEYDHYLARGFSYDRLKDYDNAIKDWLKAHELNPDSVQINTNLALVFCAIKRDYEMALQFAIINVANRGTAFDYILRGRINGLMGNIEESNADLEQSKKLANESVKLDYIETLIVLNRFNDAYKYFKNIRFKRLEGTKLIVARFYKCVAIIARDLKLEKEQGLFEKAVKTIGNDTVSWGFGDFKFWLENNDLPEEKTIKIRELFDLILAKQKGIT